MNIVKMKFYLTRNSIVLSKEGIKMYGVRPEKFK